VGELDPAVFGDDFHQVLFYGLRGFAAGQAEAAREAEDVGVYDDAFGFAVGYAKDYVGCLAGCAGNGQQFVHGLRDFVVELLADYAACALDGLGFVVVEAGGADYFFDGFEWGFAHCFWRRVGGEELGGDHVHAHVCALGAEDGGYKQLPGGAMDQGALGVGVGFGEDFQDCLDAVGLDFEFGDAVAGGGGSGALCDRFAIGWEGFSCRFLFGRFLGGLLLDGGFLRGSFCGLGRHRVYCSTRTCICGAPFWPQRAWRGWDTQFVVVRAA